MQLGKEGDEPEVIASACCKAIREEAVVIPRLFCTLMYEPLASKIMAAADQRRPLKSQTLSRFFGRWLVALPMALAPAWLMAELMRFPAGRVCVDLAVPLQKSVSAEKAQALQQDCQLAVANSVNFWLLWLIWLLLIRVSYRYWPLLVQMVSEGEKHDF